MLGDHGEFLPITFGDESAYLFNILAVADDVGGLDEKLSTKDEFDEMKSLAFHQDKVEGFSVFRTAFNNFMYVYCNATLKQAIEHEKLTAVIFSKDLGNMFPPDVSVFRVVSLLLLTFSQLTAFSSS